MDTFDKLRLGRFGPHRHLDHWTDRSHCQEGTALCALCMTSVDHDDWNEMGAVTATALVCPACVVKYDRRYAEAIRIVERRWVYSKTVQDERLAGDRIEVTFPGLTVDEAEELVDRLAQLREEPDAV